jgi:hypothetical protein
MFDAICLIDIINETLCEGYLEMHYQSIL